MTKRIAFSILFALIVQSAMGQSFFLNIYSSRSPGFKDAINSHLKILYGPDDSARSDLFDTLEDSIEGEHFRTGDYSYIYAVFNRLILADGAPNEYNSNGDYRDEIVDLQKEALKIMIKRVNDDELQLSEREMLAQSLALFVKAEMLPDFEMNEDIFDVLKELAESENPILRHTAIASLKPIVLKTGERWEDMAEKAASIFVDGVENDEVSERRVMLFECLAILKRSEQKTDAVIEVWEAVINVLDDLDSVALKQSAKRKIKPILEMKVGSGFSDQVSELREQWLDLKIKIKLNDDPMNELLEVLREEDDLEDIQTTINSLKQLALKDRNQFNLVYWQLNEFIFRPNMDMEKLRIINQGILEMVHEFGDPQYFYQSAMALLGQVYVNQNNRNALVSLGGLVQHLGSTDFEGLVLPILEVIQKSIESDLPIWIKRKLIALIYLQAGDSPNDTIAVGASRYLWQIASEADSAVLKIEALKRFENLAILSQNKDSLKFVRKKLN